MEAYDTQDAIVRALEKGFANGIFKRCIHLRYSRTPFEEYTPVCLKDSFTHRTSGFACPKDCRLFIDGEAALQVENEKAIREERRHKRKVFWQTLGDIGAAPFIYFQKLPAIVQSLIIILLIIWKLPKAKDTIIEILKAVSGK